MNVHSYGIGPINECLDFIYMFLQLRGKRVKYGKNQNVTAIKQLHQWMQEYELIPDVVTRHAKNNKKSKKLRVEGNKLFHDDSDLSKALELYNQSICWAEEDKGEELALGFANRSAVYFEWKKYDICLQNIELALKAGCPERLMEKLDKRKADCTKLMQDVANKDKDDTFDSKLLYMDTLCIKMKDRRRFQSKYFCFDDQNRCEPELSLKPNADIPFIVNCLEMKTSPQKGRYIVTTKDLKPGQIISIEDHFINSLTKEYRYRRCGNCFAENFMNQIPCRSCTCTMFCSEKCLVEAEKGFHQFECPIAEYIWTQCEEFALTLRLVVKAFTMFDSVQELIEFRDKNKKENLTAFSFDHKNYLTDKERYSQVDSLVTNEDKRNEGDMYARGCKVAILYHYLMKTTKFGQIIQTELERDTLVSVILQHTQVTSVNCFNCYEYDDVDIDAFAEFKENEIFARGMYPLSSLFNHSCAPNISTICFGTKLVTYVTRVINKDSEVALCLKRYNHFEVDIHQRKEMLRVMYGFTCECEACENDYPSVYDKDLPFGYVSDELSEAADAMPINLNDEVADINKICGILQKYSRYYPCGTLYTIGTRLHRAMTLKYGNLASQLQISLRNNCSKFSALLKK